MGAVKELAIQKRAVLQWHLTGNLYPPVDAPGFLEFAEEAIRLVSSGLPNEVVEIQWAGEAKNLTDNATGLKVTAIEVVDNWRLHDFVGSEEDESGDTGFSDQLGN